MLAALVSIAYGCQHDSPVLRAGLAPPALPSDLLIKGRGRAPLLSPLTASLPVASQQRPMCRSKEDPRCSPRRGLRKPRSIRSQIRGRKGPPVNWRLPIVELAKLRDPRDRDQRPLELKREYPVRPSSSWLGSSSQEPFDHADRKGRNDQVSLSQVRGSVNISRHLEAGVKG